jgi:uncharacterized protein YecT (DUF1311 family)
MIFAVLLFWAFSVTAKDLPDEHKCFDPATTKASEVIACVSNMRKTVEADLNEMYQDSVTQAMPPRMGASLQKTQRIWISYRDAVCKTQPAYKGEGGQFGVDLCIIKITRDRITDIDAFYIIRR